MDQQDIFWAKCLLGNSILLNEYIISICSSTYFKCC